MAASFDRTLAAQVGRALAEEAKSKGSQCLLAPTACIHRHPLGGRNFESFSEDPLLSGILASQVIGGIQSEGIAASMKHFVANEQETARMSVDVC
jgi:beta-glucosidase